MKTKQKNVRECKTHDAALNKRPNAPEYKPKIKVPSGIALPDYALDGLPKDESPKPAWVIEIKNEADIAGMRAAGKVAR